MKRKDFIKSSATLAAAGMFLQSKAASFLAADAKLRVGLIGVTGMGWSDLKALLRTGRATCTALCDVDERSLKKRIEELAKDNISNVKTYIDHREMLRDDLVDVVIIATPDHWHCMQFVDAAAAGKHIYVEKPIGNSIRECEVMVAAAQKYGTIAQVGQWQRSQQHFKDAVDFVHSGKLGKIRLVKVWAYQGWMKSIPVKPDEPVPAGVHYDRWLGPAKKRPFNPNRFHFEFRWFWDYAGGLMTDWGVHMLDYALIGMRVSEPRSVMAAGGKFAYPDSAAETPDTLTTVFEFDGFNIQWEHANGIDLGPHERNNGVAFIGEKGTLVLDRGGWEVIPEGERMDAVPRQKSQDNGLNQHMENLVEAIRKKDRSILKAPIEAGAHIAAFAQMGNIAYKTGKKLYWDKANRRFTDKDANKYLAAEYHNGYKIPKV